MAGVLRVRPRTTMALVLASVVGLVGFGWPFFGNAHSVLSQHSEDAPYLFAAMILLVLATVAAQLSEGGIDAKAVAMLGVLAAAGAGLQCLSPVPGASDAAFFLLVVAARVFGPGFGFALGSVIILASGLLMGGIGPWTPFQMFGLAWVGLGAGLLRFSSRGWVERLLLGGYVGLASLAYGGLLNLWFWPFTTSLPSGLSYVPDAGLLANLQHDLGFYLATSFGWDLLRAALNVVLVLLVARPLLVALRRAGRRAAFGALTRFEGA